jgi:hypothetical protein
MAGKRPINVDDLAVGRGFSIVDRCSASQGLTTKTRKNGNDSNRITIIRSVYHFCIFN